MINPEIKKIIQDLLSEKISIFAVPQEYENDIQLVAFEREWGRRIPLKRGFDIITNAFFLQEKIIGEGEEEEGENIISLSFDDFDAFYEFLNGDIYENACYAFCSLPQDVISSRNIDLDKFTAKQAFVEDTVDNYIPILSEEEKESYKVNNNVHEECRKWTKQFMNCNSYNELVKATHDYLNSKLCSVVDIDFFFSQYIVANVEDKHRFSVIMEYVSSGCSPLDMERALCSIYDPDDVMQSYNYSRGSTTTQYRHKNSLKKYIQLLKSGKITFTTECYFDEKTHYYCEKQTGYHRNNKAVTIKRYFETFEEFILYRKKDLRNCNLSGALECTTDFSNCVIDKTTILPIPTYKNITRFVKKYFEKGKFYVTIQWCDDSGQMIKESVHSFDFFFDFVAFLKGDLSEANLLSCDGLEHLQKWDKLNLSRAIMKSSLCEKFGVKFSRHEIREDLITSFELAEQNEHKSGLVPLASRNIIAEAQSRNLSVSDIMVDYHCQRIYYISDLHLLHRMQNANCRSKEDELYVIQKITDTIVNEITQDEGNLLLINGDVASDFSIFTLFVHMLSYALHSSHQNVRVIFTLGNHELWSFPGVPLEQIVETYRILLNKHGMYLLHNEIFYHDGGEYTEYLIPYQELCQMTGEQFFNRVRSARYIILGGLGFSGYNKGFNADSGIYRGTINRDTEIKESEKFEKLYQQLRPVLSQKNTVIMTHTPKKDWCQDAAPEVNFVYVNGHTHRNYYYDDGQYRIYADNQVGYHNEYPHLKYLLVDIDYDYFADFDNGIFEITKEQYINFCRGKNIYKSFERNTHILYMLKKNGYYCFIHLSKTGGLTILNGGACRKIPKRNIQYYYDNMETMVSVIKTPLDKYHALQTQVADTVKKIGGSGIIHGCIVDVDFENHIYVNPFDGSITGYHAYDMIDKRIYSSISTLLEKNCPEIYSNYNKLLKGCRKNPLTLHRTRKKISEEYLDTAMYQASRKISKMQKLYLNILSYWNDDAIPQKPQIESP